ncbi:hypothetical protein NPIL_584921 [Nephila pilipes]|uniref:Uncharacterized protein n=1 Tax=Nephila pilipes TaxID=299642 RepID=A0A8X6P4H7_NEPPI|nr:hypothetical protein NPIL_584921 [Nephila pilipes]
MTVKLSTHQAKYEITLGVLHGKAMPLCMRVTFKGRQRRFEFPSLKVTTVRRLRRHLSLFPWLCSHLFDKQLIGGLSNSICQCHRLISCEQKKRCLQKCSCNPSFFEMRIAVCCLFHKAAVANDCVREVWVKNKSS